MYLSHFQSLVPSSCSMFAIPLHTTRRAEVELRQRLAERDGRISQLKQDLADQGRQVDSLQRRVNELLGGNSNSASGLRTGSGGLSRVGSGVGVVSGSGLGSVKGHRSPRSPRGEQSGSQPGSAAVGSLGLPLEWTQEGEPGQQQQKQEGGWGAGQGMPSTEQIYGRISSGSSSGGSGRAGAAGAAVAAGVGGGVSLSGGSQIAAGLASAEKEYLAHQIAALRISLARRDADVARLEGEAATK